MTTVRVHLDTAAAVIAVGTARVDRLRGTETTEFAYDDSFVGGRCWEAAALDLAEACGLRTPRRRLIVARHPGHHLRVAEVRLRGGHHRAGTGGAGVLDRWSSMA